MHLGSSESAYSDSTQSLVNLGVSYVIQQLAAAFVSWTAEAEPGVYCTCMLEVAVLASEPLIGQGYVQN